MADENIVVGVEVNDNGASRNARRVAESIDDLGGSARDARFSLDPLEGEIEDTGRASRRAAPPVKRLETRIKRMGNEALKTAAKLKILDRVQRRVERSGGGGRHSKPNEKFQVGKGGLPPLISAGGGMPVTKMLGVATVLASLLPVVVTLLGALAAASLGAVGALSPIVGVVVPASAALIGMGLAIGGVVVAMKGFGDAIGAMRDTSKTIQEVRAQFYKFNTVGGKNPANQMLRDFSRLATKLTVVKGLLLQQLVPAFREMAGSVDSLLPTLSAGMRIAAVQVSSLTQRFAAFLKTTAGQEQISNIFKSSIGGLAGLGTAAYGAFRVVIDLLEAGAPVLKQMTTDLGAFFNKLSVSTATNKDGLAGFFERSYVVLQKVIKFTGDLTKAIYNIAKIGVPLGSAMGDSFLGMAESFRKFTESADGIDKIRAWFIEMTPVVYELGRLFVDVAKTLMGIGTEGGVETFFLLSSIIRENILPALAEFIAGASKELLPALLAIAIAALEMFTHLKTMEMIVPMINGLATILAAVAKIFESFWGILGWVVGAIMALVFSVKLLTMMLLLMTVAKRGAIVAATTLATQVSVLSTRLPWLASALGLTSGAAMTTSTALRVLTLTAGPLGILLTVIGLVATGIMGMTDSTEENIEANRQWAASLFDVNGALVENAAHLQAIKLAEAGAFEMADKLGIAHSDLVDAVLNGGDAYEELERKLKHGAALKDISDVAPGVTDSMTVVGDTMGDTSDTAAELLGVISPLRVGLTEAARAAAQAAPFYEELEDKTESLSRVTENLNREIQRLKGFLSERADKRGYLADLDTFKNALEENEYSFDKFTEAGRENLSNLDKVYETTMKRVQDAMDRGNFKRATNLMKQTRDDMFAIAAKLPEPQQKIVEEQIRKVEREMRKVYRLTEKQREIKDNINFVRKYTVNGKPIGSLKAAMETIPTTLQQQLAGGQTQGVKTNIDVTGSVDIKNISVVTDSTQGLVDNLLIVGSRHDPKISSTQIDTAKTKAGLLKAELVTLTGKVWTVKIKYETSGKKPGLATGGPAFAGQQYVVGERGPELFMGNSGRMTMIGVHGQEQRTFAEDGFVVPNHALPEVKDSSLSGEYTTRSTAPVINIGTINAQSEFDVVKAVKRGIAEAERNRKERS